MDYVKIQESERQDMTETLCILLVWMPGGWSISYKSCNWYISTGYFLLNGFGGSEALPGIRYIAKMEMEYPSVQVSIWPWVVFVLFLYGSFIYVGLEKNNKQALDVLIHM